MDEGKRDGVDRPAGGGQRDDHQNRGFLATHLTKWTKVRWCSECASGDKGKPSPIITFDVDSCLHTCCAEGVKTRIPLKYFFLSAGIAFMAGESLHAASITWQAPHDITGDADVSTTGSLVQAVSIGPSGVDFGTTVNGVTFAPFAPDLGNNTIGIFTLSGVYGLYNGYGGGTAFSALSSAYRTLLQNGDFGSGNSVMTLTISASGLTTGHTYQFQWWANDSRANFIPQTVDATAGNSVTVNANTANTANGIGQYAIGTFVANGADEVITFQGGANGGTLENGFQLRDISAVPEPASVLLLGLGACAMMARRRRG